MILRYHARLARTTRRLPASLLLVGVIFLGAAPPAAGYDDGVIGQDQRVLVIGVKFSDYSTPRYASVQSWVNLLNQQVRTYYDRATFGQTTFTFESPAAAPNGGWFNLGYPASQAEFAKSTQDAVDLIDPWVDFSRYNRIVVITSTPYFAGCGCKPFWLKVDEGAEAYTGIDPPKGIRMMSASFVSEWQDWYKDNDDVPYNGAAAVIAHELGHQLDLPTHYFDPWPSWATHDAVSGWDIMGYSPSMIHFLAYTKSAGGWIPPNRIFATPALNAASTYNQEILLYNQEQPRADGYQMIKIPYSAGSSVFKGYTLEIRHRVNGDDELTDDGLLVTKIDESKSWGERANVVYHAPYQPGGPDRSTLHWDEAFTDSARGLTVQARSATGKVQVFISRTTPFAADLELDRGSGTKTPDIWLDSDKNGLGVYTTQQASGAAVIYDDEPWEGRPTRVHVRVHNVGAADAAAPVRARVYRSAVGGACTEASASEYLGEIVLPRIAWGQAAEGYVVAEDGFSSDTCIMAKAVGAAGETDLDNNTAFERVGKRRLVAIDLGRNVVSRYPELKTRIEWRLPEPPKPDPRVVNLGSFVNVRDVPRGWTIDLGSGAIVDPTNGLIRADVRVLPPASLTLSDRLVVGERMTPKLEILVPYADTYVPVETREVDTAVVEDSAVSFELIRAGSRLTVEGTLKPAITGARVAVEFLQARPGNPAVRTLVHAVVRRDGTFTAVFDTPTPAAWTAQAFYAGDSHRAESESAMRWLARKRGDMNGDERVSVQDAQLALRVVAGLIRLDRNAEEPARAAMDVNGDGRRTVADVSLMLRIAAGLPIPSLPGLPSLPELPGVIIRPPG